MPQPQAIEQLMESDITKLSMEQLDEMLVKLDMVEAEANRVWGVYNFRPHKRQGDFLYSKNKLGCVPYIRIVECGNKWGKCMTYQTLIDTPEIGFNGSISIGELYHRGTPFKVYAWDGKHKVVATANPPFKKEGLHKCYKIALSNGKVLEAADRHWILTSLGWQHVQSLYECSQVLRESNLEFFPSVHASGVLHWSEKQLGYLRSCFEDFHQYDEQPRWEQDIDRVFAPSKHDVHKYNHLFGQRDDRVFLMPNSPLTKLGLPSIWDDLKENVGRFFECASQVFYKLAQCNALIHQYVQRPSIVEAYSLQSCGGFSTTVPQKVYVQTAFSSPFGKCDIKIKSITPILTRQEVYDFTVPKYHNYFAGGIIHHNTESGIAEDLAHMVGFRPWLEKDDPNYWIRHGGRRIPVPNQGLVVGETITHSVMEKIFPTFEKLLPQRWGGKFKKNSQGHITGLKLTRGVGRGSQVYFRSYDQPAKDFEGIDYHWSHMDEPPPENHMNAIRRGLVAYSGCAWLTMTPLKEPYIYDDYSAKADGDKIVVVTGSIWDNSIENGGYLDPEAINNFLDSLPPEEREAREFGKWKHFAGVVYKSWDRDVHEVADFTVPKDWTPYEGIDPADGKDTKWLFFRVSDEEFTGADKKKMYRAYCTGYLSLPPKLTINEMVREARIFRARMEYDKPRWIVLDAKYGTRRIKTDTQTTSWEKELKKADRGTRYVLSESKPGDVELGIKLVKDYLRPKYSVLLEREVPTLVFFKEACSGDGGPVHEMLRYRRDVNQKLVDEDDDCPDVIRYFCMKRPKYRDNTERRSRWPETSYEKAS